MAEILVKSDVVLLMKPSILSALETMESIWLTNDNEESNVTPRSQIVEA